MTGHEPTGWEPDPQKMGNWQSMFDSKRQAGMSSDSPTPLGTETPCESQPDDDALSLDLTVYRPWILQRGRTRPAMMLEFRRYEARSRLWSGCAIAYPYLLGLEYTGDKLLSLDFGKSQVMLEGAGLDELARHIQQGTVMAVQEYAASLWPARSVGPIVSTIRRLGVEDHSAPG